jgi:hypothetical protein
MAGNATAYSAAPSTRSLRLLSSAATDNATVGADGPYCAKNIIGMNNRTSKVFLKLYDKLTAPASTDTPLVTFDLPASSAFAIDLGDGLVFNKGLGYRLTTGSADNDTGAVASGDITGLNILGL